MSLVDGAYPDDNVQSLGLGLGVVEMKTLREKLSQYEFHVK
jgi:hypothetical protein